jgi:MtN3 and saliva related transmembrane protein
MWECFYSQGTFFSFMVIETFIGLVAATLTTVSFLPQVIHTWKEGNARGISLLMYVLFCSGVLLWLVYGILIRDLPVIAANAITLALASIVLYFKLRYG